MQWTDETRVVAAKDQVWCELGDEVVVLSLEGGVYYGLDPVGARIWRLLQEPRTCGELRAACLAEYAVDAERLDADMGRLLRELTEHKLVQTAPSA